MNSLDLLSSLPPFRDWTPADVLASPAWAMPCRLGKDEGRLVSEGALLPADPLRLAVRFADESALLALADSPLFPELHALWPARADVPPTLLLALVEKECGPLLQLLENLVGRQLAIDGLASPAGEAASGDSAAAALDRSVAGHTWPARAFRLLRASGEALCSFALTLSPALVEAFGALRNLDPAHPAIRDTAYPAVVQLAAPTLSSDDLASLAPGDHLLLPEVEPAPADAPGAPAGSLARKGLSCPGAVLLIEGHLAASAAGLAPWSDPGSLRVVLADPATTTLADLVSLAAGASGAEGGHPAFGIPHSALREGAALALLRGPATLATGRIGAVAAQPSFEIETVTPQP